MGLRCSLGVLSVASVRRKLAVYRRESIWCFLKSGATMLL
jgi:hypothetical protein